MHCRTAGRNVHDAAVCQHHQSRDGHGVLLACVDGKQHQVTLRLAQAFESPSCSFSSPLKWRTPKTITTPAATSAPATSSCGGTERN